MDGAVVVQRHTGALHCTLSFTTSFERRYPKDERMNLAALLFALQNFAGNALVVPNAQSADQESDLPNIALLETPIERIAMSQSRRRGLLIALFAGRSVAAGLLKSIAQRLAIEYDCTCSDDDGRNTGVNTRQFRALLSKALEETVKGHLKAFAQEELRHWVRHGVWEAGDFVLLYASPSLDVVGQQGQPHEETTRAGPRTNLLPTSRGASRLQRISTSFRSFLSAPTRRRRMIPRNVIADQSDPKTFQVLVSSLDTDAAEKPFTNNVDQFVASLMSTVVPFLRQAIPLVLSSTTHSGLTPALREVTWRRFPLRKNTEPCVGIPSEPAKAANVCIWPRRNCVLVFPGQMQLEVSTRASQMSSITKFMDDVEPLANIILRL